MEDIIHGLINQKPEFRDWMLGGLTPLEFGVATTGGDWSDFLPVVEYQNRWQYDRLACVTYSALNCLEILYTYQTGKERNFSDRFTARMSNTGRQGNTMAGVFDAIRNYGLIDENRYPDTMGGWDEYYKDIPQELQNEAKEILAKWSVYREWVNPYKKEDIYLALKSSPLQVNVKYAGGSGLLNPVGDWNHAVTLYNAEKGYCWDIFDHYTQTIKKYAWDYEFGSVLKPTLTKKNIMPNFKKDHAYQLVQGNEQKTGLYVEEKGLYIGESIDVLVNSAMRLNTDFVPTPKETTLADWNAVEHYNLKGELI